MAPALRLACPNGHNTGNVRCINIEHFLRTPLAFDEKFPLISKVAPQAQAVRLTQSSDGGMLELECDLCLAHWLVAMDTLGRIQDDPYYPRPLPNPRTR